MRLATLALTAALFTGAAQALQVEDNLVMAAAMFAANERCGTRFAIERIAGRILAGSVDHNIPLNDAIIRTALMGVFIHTTPGFCARMVQIWAR